MISSVRRAGLVVVLALAAAVSAAPHAGAAPPDRLGADLRAVIDGGATSVLTVIDSGRRTVAASAGPRRLDRPGAVDPTGRFRAGSVTKSFLATVVLQLVQTGRVRLEAPIARYVPGVRAGDRITVRMLLDHTSGLYNITDTLPLNPPSGFLAIRWRHWSPRELLARTNAHRLWFTPGRGWRYSDTDYLVLGMMVQRVTGHSPRAEIMRRIVRPLGLRDTTLPATTGIAGRHAHAYLPMPDGTLTDITRFDPSVLRYGGELVSSGADLNRFFLALERGRLLRPALLREMHRVGRVARDYGLGIRRIRLTCGATAWGHDGDVPGSSTWAFTMPGSARAVTVSMTWGRDRPKQAALAVVDHALCGRR